MKKFLYAALSLLMLASVSCSDDQLKGTDTQTGPEDDNAPGVYIGINFQMPGMGGSRSTTTDPSNPDNDPDNPDKWDQSGSNDGTEVGKDYENNVNEVYLILAREKDFGFIGGAKVQSDDIFRHSENSSSGNAGSYHADAKFEKEQLNTYYGDKGNFSTTIAVFVVVNPNFDKLDVKYGDTEWINKTWEVKTVEGSSAIEGSIWSEANGGNFLMTNSRIALREIPANIEDWEFFSKKDTPFNLSEVNKVSDIDIDNSKANTGRGPVNVHRACARFDFKDGSKGDNTYDAIYLQTKEGRDSKYPFIAIKLERLSLVNMNNKFYYFERVSPLGLPASDPLTSICQPEKAWYSPVTNEALYNPQGGNYVVDAWADVKFNVLENGTYNNLKFSDYFVYPLFEDGGGINSANLGSQTRWASTEISDILDNENDNYKEGEYHIWRYVTENVIPFTDKPYEYFQPNGLTTGVVFRGRMIGRDLPSVDSEDYSNLNLSDSERIRFQHVVDAINSQSLKVGQGDEEGINEDNFPWKNPILYSYAKKLYATWNDICAAAIESSLAIKKENGEYVTDWNRSNSLYEAVFGSENYLSGCEIVYNIAEDSYNVYLPGVDKDIPTDEYTGEGENKTRVYVFFKDWDDETENKGLDPESANYAWNQWYEQDKPQSGEYVTAFKKAVTDAEIRIYQRSKEDGIYGYYCYYYYWNRHNDNNRDGVMGPMEFCTVRNNVYKLSVSKISNLGHPRLDENDPYKPTPGTPDESSNVYITVDSKVIPWVVRVNDIEF